MTQNPNRRLLPYRGIVPATPVCAAYESCLVQAAPGRAEQVYLYNGRLCYLSSTVRAQIKRGYRAYWNAIICYLDDGTFETMPLGHFNKGAGAAPIPEPLEGDALRDAIHSWLDRIAPAPDHRAAWVATEAHRVAQTVHNAPEFRVYTEAQII